MHNKLREKIANLFLFVIIFSELRFAIIYKTCSSLLFVIRDKRMGLLMEYILFPTIIYVIYILIKGQE